MAERRRRRSRVREAGTESRSREVRQAGEVVDSYQDIQHPTHEVDPEPARVKVSGGITQSLGDFNFVRVDVSIERPCPNNDLSIEEMYDNLSGAVDTYLQNELDVAIGNGNEENYDPPDANSD